jgi:hypothetical protein
MLSAELRGQGYSKAEHRRNLLPLLRDRSEGAIERKHGNISAVLIELGFPYIEGYKPFTNYQRLLLDVVASRLGASANLETLAAADAEIPAVPPMVDNILASLVAVPPGRASTDQVREGPLIARGISAKYRRVNYLEREAANASLGKAGELFILEFERARLIAAGQERLASKIEHVSVTRGDGDGFDILSFEESGRERLIEVKTTKYGALTPFFVSSNEVEVSDRESDRYHLYRVFGFRRTPKVFDVPGSLSISFSLRPMIYRAVVA